MQIQSVHQRRQGCEVAQCYAQSPPLAGQAEGEIILSAMKERVATTADLKSHTVDTFCDQVDDGVKRTLRHQGEGSGVKDLTPFRSTISGDAFLGHGEGMLIFASEGDLQFLTEARHWFGNGTFKVTPVGFKQQYSIHACFDGVPFLSPWCHLSLCLFCCLEKVNSHIKIC